MSRELRSEEWNIMGGGRDLHGYWGWGHKGCFPGKVAPGWEFPGSRKEIAHAESKGPGRSMV